LYVPEVRMAEFAGRVVGPESQFTVCPLEGVDQVQVIWAPEATVSGVME
jgi:hypothetical protein